jgi:hypothetical protein
MVTYYHASASFVLALLAGVAPLAFFNQLPQYQKLPARR